MKSNTLSSVNPKYYDPDFSNCDGTSIQCYMGWSLRVIGGSGFAFYGLGFWQVSIYYDICLYTFLK